MQWEAVTFQKLAQLVNSGAWRWEKKGRALQLRAHDGALYDFKLQGKPHVRLAEQKKAPCPPTS